MADFHTHPVYLDLQNASTDPLSGIRPLDFHIGSLLAARADQSGEVVLLAAALASAAIAQGHACLPLNNAAKIVPGIKPAHLGLLLEAGPILLNSGIVTEPGGTAPLILDAQQRLYLYRYQRYQQQIAQDLIKRADAGLKINLSAARDTLQKLALIGKLDPGQQTAAALALIRPLVLISGGPGTGKTHTLAYTLALIQALADQPLRIALAAPTGKAAARMNASISKAKAGMPADLADAVPSEAQTLHRLLGQRPGADDFTYNQSNPLAINLLVVDEASMLDLVMMDGLIRALPEDCRLILMGDHHQLPSVEAGNVFADLCGDGEPSHHPDTLDALQQLLKLDLPGSSVPSTAIKDAYTRLSTNHRQAGAETLSTLAEAVDKGDFKPIRKLAGGSDPEVDIQFLNGDARLQWLNTQIIQRFGKMLSADSLEQAFDSMENFRFLCAVREGPMGIEGINRLAEALLRHQGLISGEQHYRGKPIIIRHNQYRLHLFNGDSGLLWPDSNGKLKAWFRNQSGEFRDYELIRLPEHDSAYAITIHQAQGSEFNQVVLLLPEEDSRVLSRELVYTGVTRARASLSLCCDSQILQGAIESRTQRYSGLREALSV